MQFKIKGSACVVACEVLLRNKTNVNQLKVGHAATNGKALTNEIVARRVKTFLRQIVETFSRKVS